ncbi:MAG: ABC transporter permease subunit [Hyphomicrobiaceae bacterium]
MSTPSLSAVAGRSLWAEAWARLLRNRAAVASCGVLAVVALAAVIGPFLTGHPYDKVYPDYVRVPARLAAYPEPERIGSALDRVAARLRAKVERFTVQDDRLTAIVAGTQPIDPRLLAYFERSDLFGPAKIAERADDGRRLTLEVPIVRRFFWFGTDGNGRDLLARTLIAGRVSLAIGLLATFVALIVGVSYGAVAGYAGGRIDDVMMRIVDILYSLPFIFFVILLVVFFGRNFVLMFIAVGAIEWLDMARIVRGQTLSIKRREYMLAAEALGVGSRAILVRHVIPNTLGPVVVYMTLLVPKVILLESFLSFLGLGVQEPMTSWGVLIAEGARSIQGAAYLLIFPSIFLVATLFALNFIGDGLRDALDPRDR